MHNLFRTDAPAPAGASESSALRTWYNTAMKNTDQKKAFYVRRVERGMAHVAKRCPWCGKLHQVMVPLDDVEMEYVRQLPCGKYNDPAVFDN